MSATKNPTPRPPLRAKAVSDMATKEERFVVDPLEAFLLNPQRSNAKWRIKERPKHGTSATGWDLQAERKNKVLLVEAKYIVGPFAAAMAGLILAPLTRKKEKMKSGRKQGSWCASVAWAIGCDPSKHRIEEIYQILLDYLSRNLTFWQCYARELNVKYIFFVKKRKVARINFTKLFAVAKRYAPMADAFLPEKRARAKKLMSFVVFR